VSNEPKGAVIVTAPEDKESDILARAIDWVMAENPSDDECPFCSRRFTVNESSVPNRKHMRLHLREQHTVRCVQAHTEKNLDASIRNDQPVPIENFHELAGIEVEQDLDRFDALYVSPQLKREVEKAGGSLRWVRPDKIEQYKAQGGELVEAKGQNMGPRQGSTENTSVRANELVLMRFAAEPTIRRRRVKSAKADSILQSSKENLLRNQDAVEKAVYDGMIRRNYDKQTAGQVARAIASGQSGNWKGGDSRQHQGIRIERGGNITEI